MKAAQQRERTRRGHKGGPEPRVVAKRGRIPVNHVPDGYRVGDGRTPEVDDERATVIRRIFRHYVEDGMGAPAIVETLTSDGVPPARPGASWHATRAPPCRAA